MRILVLGGNGFLGRHVVSALRQRGHVVVVGSRFASKTAITGADPLAGQIHTRFETLLTIAAWYPLIQDVEMVINCVGILRARWRESFDQVHHQAIAALAAACAIRNIRFIHVSIPGLNPAIVKNTRDDYLGSKWRGEQAVRASRADYSIVRPALLDGADGYGARFLRWLAGLPVQLIPAAANGLIAPVCVSDVGEAIASLGERRAWRDWREVELAGSENFTMAAYLRALRDPRKSPVWQIAVPASLARLAAWICDRLHFTPYSVGHDELMRYDSVPAINHLPQLLGRTPTKVGVIAQTVTDLPAPWAAIPGGPCANTG